MDHKSIKILAANVRTGFYEDRLLWVWLELGVTGPERELLELPEAASRSSEPDDDSRREENRRLTSSGMPPSATPCCAATAAAAGFGTARCSAGTLPGPEGALTETPPPRGARTLGRALWEGVLEREGEHDTEGVIQDRRRFRSGEGELCKNPLFPLAPRPDADGPRKPSRSGPSRDVSPAGVCLDFSTA